MYILLGVDVPLILRKETETYFTQVGEAYVYGIMDGEFMRTKSVIDTLELH